MRWFCREAAWTRTIIVAHSSSAFDEEVQCKYRLSRGEWFPYGSIELNLCVVVMILPASAEDCYFLAWVEWCSVDCRLEGVYECCWWSDTRRPLSRSLILKEIVWSVIFALWLWYHRRMRKSFTSWRTQASAACPRDFNRCFPLRMSRLSMLGLTVSRGIRHVLYVGSEMCLLILDDRRALVSDTLQRNTMSISTDDNSFDVMESNLLSSSCLGSIAKQVFKV
jgi:hypothetical protein